MAVRVKVKIESLKGNRGKINTVALVNAGYESDDPEIVLPSRLAEKLGLWPELPEGSRVEEYGSANFWSPVANVSFPLLAATK